MTEVSRYRLLDKVISGRLSVYRAIDPDLGREIAVKVLEEPDASIQESFRRAARDLAQLNHPNIEHILEIGSFDDGGIKKSFVVTPFLHGSPLDKLILSSGPLPIQKVVDILSQTCTAVAFIGLAMHADIHSSNIFVQDDALVKLIDLETIGPLDALASGTLQDPVLALAHVAHEALAGASGQVSGSIQAVIGEAEQLRFASAGDFLQRLREAAKQVEIRELKERRYQELVDKKFLNGLSAKELRELDDLFTELSRYDEEFYGPLIENLTRPNAKPKT